MIAWECEMEAKLMCQLPDDQLGLHALAVDVAHVFLARRSIVSVSVTKSVDLALLP